MALIRSTSNWKGLPFSREHHEHVAEQSAPLRRFSRRGPFSYVVAMRSIIRGVTAARTGREFTANLVRTSRATVDFSRILTVGWPHIVSSLDASLDLVTTAALSLPAQEANRSASPAHICSALLPSLPHLHRTKLDDLHHHQYRYYDTSFVRHITKISPKQ
jgi:hypothetical protein